MINKTKTKSIKLSAHFIDRKTRVSGAILINFLLSEQSRIRKRTWTEQKWIRAQQETGNKKKGRRRDKEDGSLRNSIDRIQFVFRANSIQDASE